MLKIAMIGQKGLPAKAGGIERHVEEIVKRLAKENCQITVYGRKHYSLSNFQIKGVRILNLPTINTKNLDTITYTFLATLHALFQRYDIIHYHGVGPSSLLWLVRLLKPETKVVATYHCDDSLHQKWGWFAKKYLRFGGWVACHLPHKVITVSETLVRKLKDRYGCDALYLPNGAISRQPLRSYASIKKWGLKKNNYIVSVSRLIPHKGLHYLIEAHKETKTGLKLVIVGDGSYTDKYVQRLHFLARGSENIIFTGLQTGHTLAELFSNAYLFVQPSLVEGLSIALLEAMSFGKAVLVSDIPENREVVKNDGFIFKTGDVKDLKTKLQFLVGSPAIVKKRGLACRREILRNYNWDKITKGLFCLYQDLVQKRLESKKYSLLPLTRFLSGLK